MDAKEAYAKGREVLTALWERVTSGGEQGAVNQSVNSAISRVMSPDSGVGHLYSLPTQLLLMLTIGLQDGRQLTNFEGIKRFSSRSFAKAVVLAFEPLSQRLGTSPDPYVTQPLRRDRLRDDDFTGSDKETWQALVSVLDYVSGHPEEVEAVLLRTLSDAKVLPIQTNPSAEPPTSGANNFPSVVEATGLDDDFLLDIIGVLQSNQPQVIFAGPPGTSKTYVAVALAALLTNGDESAYKVVQLHASYGYEEFVEGLRPMPGKHGFDFDVHPGAVRRIATDWKADDFRVLVVDEMNRANLPRVLGELLYALEHRESPVDLMYTEGFKLPAGLAFIGTMNTADRSIRSIDAAVRRRFQIFNFPPNGKILEAFYDSHNNEIEGLRDGFDNLNATLTNLLDRHHTIGHTFLMHEDGMTPLRLRQVWDRKILPLIDEYLFDQPDVLGEFTLERFWPAMVGD